jgi:dipeptide/tripeptide permease
MLGIGVTSIGFFVLSFTDPKGQNAASQVSPFLIVLGYALIGYGILSRQP